MLGFESWFITQENDYVCVAILLVFAFLLLSNILFKIDYNDYNFCNFIFKITS